ncbi:hypothetical protein UlMin_004869 [Ulmus minor]
MIHQEVLAARSSKIASILRNNGGEGDLSRFLRDIPGNGETLEVVARFCHGHQFEMTAENIIPLTCVAHYLGMTEHYSKNNLLTKAFVYFQHKILPSWNETIKALRSADNVVHQALQIGLIDASFQSIIAMAQSDPRLLGDPCQPRRRLFVQSQDLTTLSLQIYQPLIQQVINNGVQSEYVISSLCNYVRKWVFPSFEEEETLTIYKRNYQREIIEQVEKLLPAKQGTLSCAFLFEMLRCSILLEACEDCRNGIELRIGKQLDQATIKDVLLLSQQLACDDRVKSLRTILRHFCENFTENCSNISPFLRVAVLLEDLLAEFAKQEDLKIESFCELAELSKAVTLETQRSFDGIYKGMDIYLNAHKHLTETEKERVCEALECQRMSTEACEHAAKNERLPLRVVVQVMFAVQLQLKDSITNEVNGSQDGYKIREAEEEEEEEVVEFGEEEGAMRMEMEKMNKKLMDLERECCVMKKEMIGSSSGEYCRIEKKEKVSLWKEMKRKFGCINSTDHSNCQVKKKKKKNNYLHLK